MGAESCWDGNKLEDITKQKLAAMTDTLDTMLAPIANFWEQETQKHKERNFGPPNFGLFRDQRTKGRGRALANWGPGGALGIGCGAGIGVAVTGGAGVGSSLWNELKLVFGIGIGCGVGLGYGYGQGFGVRWDQRPKRTPSKRVVIEI